MPHLRDLFNELKWKQDYPLEHIKIWYIHRGAPQDTKIVSGGEITGIGKSFLYTITATIPYHRIFKITFDEKVLFEREAVVRQVKK